MKLLNVLNLSQFLILGLLPAFARADSSVNPAYSQFKTLRNYFVVKAVSPTVHHIQVWYIDIEPVFATIEANSADEIKNLPKEKMRGWTGAFGVPPKSIPPVPADEKDMADAAVALVQKYHPNARNILVGSAGVFRKVAVSEIVPQSPSTNPPLRSTINSDVVYAVDEGFTHATAASGEFQMIGGISNQLCLDLGSGNTDCSAAPNVVDFVMPESIQGSPLFANATEKGAANPIYAAAYADFVPQMLQTARAVFEKNYHDVLPAILQKQGSTLLPVGLNQIASLEFRVGATPTDPNQQGDMGQIEFQMPLSELVAGGGTYHVLKDAPNFGLHLELTVSLAKETANLKISDDFGHSDSIDYTLEGSLLTDGDRIALNRDYFGKRTDGKIDGGMPAGTRFVNPRFKYLSVDSGEALFMAAIRLK